MLTLPAALALAVVRLPPIMLVLFGRGAFDATESAMLSAQALAAYAFGLPAFVLLKVLVPAFFAHGDTGTPVRVGFVGHRASTSCLNLLFMVPLQHVGPRARDQRLRLVQHASSSSILLSPARPPGPLDARLHRPHPPHGRWPPCAMAARPGLPAAQAIPHAVARRRPWKWAALAARWSAAAASRLRRRGPGAWGPSTCGTCSGEWCDGGPSERRMA